MKILSIETSCDETGIALVQADGGFSNPRFNVLKNLVSSQIKIHRPFGGVVPGLAKREHIKNLPILWKRIMNQDLRFKNEKIINHKSKFLNQINLIAVTVGPGLEPALWTGIEFAKQIHADLRRLNRRLTQNKKIGENPCLPAGRRVSNKSAKPKLVGVNHLEGHLYSFLLTQKRANSKSKILNPKRKSLKSGASNLEFPAVALLVSGGHTTLLLMKDLKTWKRLGETKDDAAGEAFDKVARMLNLPYPGGPEIEKIAKKGNLEAIAFPRPMLNQKNYDFSFSGLKTAVFYYLRDKKLSTNNEFNTNIRIRKFATDSLFADVAASFQQAVIDVLVAKTMRAAKEFGARSVILCGGVAASKKLRRDMKGATRLRRGFGGQARDKKMNFFVPDMEYNNDNAAMIAAAAYMGLSRKKKYKIEADGDLNI